MNNCCNCIWSGCRKYGKSDSVCDKHIHEENIHGKVIKVNQNLKIIKKINKIRFL